MCTNNNKEIETRLENIEKELDELKKKKTSEDSIEIEIEEDVHCLVKFIKRIMCVVL